MSNLDIKLLPSAPASFHALVELLDWSEDLDFAYAWMDTGSERSELWHALDETKIRRGIVGLHFAGTDPAALEFFLDTVPDRVRVMLDTKGTFHPKVIVGCVGTARQALLGSSNLTPSGFGNNTELNVLVSGSDSDPFFRELDSVIARCWYRGDRLTSDFIASYRRKWERRPRPPRLERRGHPSRVRAAADLETDWEAYVALLRDQEKRGVQVFPADPAVPTYVREAEEARDFLRSAGSFAKLPKEKARYVAGFGPGVGYFGSTRPNGIFKNMVLDKPELVGGLIDPIPMTGPVDDELVRQVFERAEPLPKVGMGVVTRLLTVKRPDLFLPINNANKRRIRELFGSQPENVHQYLELVHMVRRFPWARSARPSDAVEGRLWDARVGLLDAVVYEPA